MKKTSIKVHILIMFKNKLYKYNNNTPKKKAKVIFKLIIKI